MLLKKNTKKNIFVAGMLLIPVAHFIVFWVAVNFNSILLAFQRFDRAIGGNYFTFNNFKDMAALFGKNGGLRIAFANTFLTWGFTVIFLLPWGFTLTYLLYKKIALSSLWRTMLFVPALLPTVALTSIFLYIILPEAPVGKFFALFRAGTPYPFLEAGYARWTVIGYFFLTNFGGQFVLLSGAMSRIPKEVIESAKIDGAGTRVEMLRIVLPLCWPTISMILLLNVTGIFTASGPVMLLTGGGGNTTTVSFWIFNSVRNNSVYMPAALGILLTVILFPIVLLARWGLGKVYADVEF